MHIEGLKGCYEKTRGIFYSARMCSKISLHAAGKLPNDYHELIGQGFDGRICRFLSVRYEDVKAQVLSGRKDEEVLDWCLAHGRRLTEEQVLIINSFLSKRGWHDDQTDGYIPDRIKQYGLRNDGSVITGFDLIEMDEGRWYPDMWRDAWKPAGGDKAQPNIGTGTPPSSAGATRKTQVNPKIEGIKGCFTRGASIMEPHEKSNFLSLLSRCSTEA